MILLSLVFAAFTALLGHISAITLPGLLFEGIESTPTAGMMAVAAGVMFAATLLLAPRHGLLMRSVQHLRLSLRIAREDVLGLLYRLEEQRGREKVVTDAEIAGHLTTRGAVRSFAVAQLRRRGRLARHAGGYALTEDGRTRAKHLIRSHRLWETFLHERVGLKPDHVHGTAEQMEHLTDTAMAEQLAEAVGKDRRDPHGREIPKA